MTSNIVGKKYGLLGAGIAVLILAFMLINSSKPNELEEGRNEIIEDVGTPEKEQTLINDNLPDSASSKSNLRTLKIIKTSKGIYKFGLAKLEAEGVKTTWQNDGNFSVYGISYLFIERGESNKPLRRTDPSKRKILSCEVDQKVVVEPGETFDTFDMIDERTRNYEVKLVEINPLVSWHEIKKIDCKGNPVYIKYHE